MRELPTEFEGIGEVKGWNFTQLKKTELGYLYKRESEGLVYYEVFRRKENHIAETMGTGEAIISYPNANSFGIWAWCLKEHEYDRAIAMLDNMEPIIPKIAIQSDQSGTISEEVEQYTTQP